MSAAQLRSCGLDGNAVARRVCAGRLHRLDRGVYAVGHTALARDGRLFAALLGTGPGAVISHRSAADLWELAASASTRVDVLTTRRCDRRPGVCVYRTRHLPAEDVAALRGVPVTSVARTLVDLAAVVDARRLKRAVHQAEILRHLDVDAVVAVIDRSRGRRGTGALRRLLAVPAPPARSELEARFLELCEAAHLPPPAVNTRIADHEVDFVWIRERLIAETDGVATHLTRHAFEQDRRRDVALARAGFQVVRFTWRRLVDETDGVANDLRELLAARASALGVADTSRGAG